MPVLQAGGHALFFRSGDQARQHGQAQREGGQAALEVAEVLQGQDGGRAEEGGLLAVGHHAQGGAQGHLGLAEADVAADQAVHGEIGLQVGQHPGDGLLLVLGLHEAEILLQPVLQLGHGGQRQLADGLAHGVEVEQVARVVDDGLAGALGLEPPGLAAQAVLGRRAALAAAVALEHVQLVQRHVEELAVGVLDLQELGGQPLELQALEAGELADAVLAVHDPVPQLHVLQPLLGRDLARPGLFFHVLEAAPAQDDEAQDRVLERAGNVEEMALQRRQLQAQVLQQPRVGGVAEQPVAGRGLALQLFQILAVQRQRRLGPGADLRRRGHVGAEVGEVDDPFRPVGEGEERFHLGGAGLAVGHGGADAAEIVQQLAVLVLDLLQVLGQQPAAGQQLGQESVGGRVVSRHGRGRKNSGSRRRPRWRPRRWSAGWRGRRSAARPGAAPRIPGAPAGRRRPGRRRPRCRATRARRRSPRRRAPGSPGRSACR